MRTKRHIGLAILGLAFALSPLLASRVHPNAYESGRSRDAVHRQLRNSSAVATMLGEFRTSVSDMLLVKTDRYLHAGVVYEAHEDAQPGSAADTAKALAQHDEEAAEHEHHGQEESVGTAIRSPQRDFRGIIGKWHREVKPWHDQHAHVSDSKELLPWFRLMTLSDPYYVRGYAIGAYWLSRTHPEIGERFLQEGIRNNPKAFSLHLMLGQIYLARAREEVEDMFRPQPEQRALFLQARDAYRKAADLVLAQRPHGNVEADPSWGYYKEDDAWAALRMAVLTEKQYGSPQQAAEQARQYLAVAGPDGVLERAIARIEKSK